MAEPILVAKARQELYLLPKAVHTIGTQIGRQLVRGVLDSLLGGWRQCYPAAGWFCPDDSDST